MRNIAKGSRRKIIIVEQVSKNGLECWKTHESIIKNNIIWCFHVIVESIDRAIWTTFYPNLNNFSYLKIHISTLILTKKKKRWTELGSETENFKRCKFRLVNETWGSRNVPTRTSVKFTFSKSFWAVCSWLELFTNFQIRF